MSLAGKKLIAYQNARLLDESAGTALQSAVADMWLINTTMLGLVAAGSYAACCLVKHLVYVDTGVHFVVSLSLAFAKVASTAPLLILGSYA